MCDHPNREMAMVTVMNGVWCDPCLVPLIDALNSSGVQTVASCCGHGKRPGSIALADGRWLMVCDQKEFDVLSRVIHTTEWWDDPDNGIPAQRSDTSEPDQNPHHRPSPKGPPSNRVGGRLGADPGVFLIADGGPVRPVL